MKDLVTVFTYCPDDERKVILVELLNKLQSVRPNFDILVVSHSELPNTISKMVDYTFIENDNKLLFDFDIRNKFWFKTDRFNAHSSLIYPFSTHLSIYSLLHYVLNFAKFKNYSKVHCIEYDINFDNTEIVGLVNQKLDEHDNLIFKSDDGWCHGIYFAFKIEGFPENYFSYDENFIKDEIKNVETRMTEHYTPKFLSVGGRKTFFESTNKINSEGILQIRDSHGNNELNWCIPIVDKNDELLYFLVFNEKGGEYDMDVIINGKHISVQIDVKGSWKLIPLGIFEEVNSFKLLVNGELKHNITFNSENRDKFKNNNFFIRK